MGKKRKRDKEESAAGEPSDKRQRGSDTTGKDGRSVTSHAKEPAVGDHKRQSSFYGDLCSEDSTVRTEAAQALIRELLGREANDAVSESILQLHLRRLFAGLGSGRKATRIGFSLVITEILWQLFGDPSLSETTYLGSTFEEVLSSFLDTNRIRTGMPSQEERDHSLGQLFGLECFVKAKVLAGDTTRWPQLLDLLLSLANKKVWLRSQCAWVVVQAVDQITKDDAKETLRRVSTAGIAKTPDGVAIWLAVTKKFPKVRIKPWRHPLSPESLEDLAIVLKDGLVEKANGDSNPENSDVKKSNWTAQLHFVWDMIAAHYGTLGNDSSEDFSSFWTRVVDDGLYAETATDSQKFRGFAVFNKMITELPHHEELLSTLFSRNLMACMMNHATDENRYLHRAATKALKAIEGTVESHPECAVPVLKGLAHQNGTYAFDTLTKSKTVEKILQNIRNVDAQSVISLLEPSPRMLSQDPSARAKYLQAYVNYLYKMVDVGSRMESGSGDHLISSLALERLIRLAYARPGEDTTLDLPETVKNLCRGRLESTIAKATRRAEDLVYLPNAVLSIDKGFLHMDEEISSELDIALSNMKELLRGGSAKPEDKKFHQGLALLYAVSILQLYNEEPDVIDTLADLKVCYSGLRGDGRPGRTKEASTHLVEILLSLVARPSSLMRQVSKQVFGIFTRHISPEAIKLLSDALYAKENLAGQKALFDPSDDTDMVDEDEDDEGEDDEDEDDESETSGSAFNGVASDAEDDSNNKELEDLDRALSQALKSHRLDRDDDASTGSESEMSDSEMLALDDQLARAFKNRMQAQPQGKKAAKDAKSNVLNFKNRVVDFFEIYLKHESLNGLAFTILPPLLNLARTTTSRDLASRAAEAIKSHHKQLGKMLSKQKESFEETRAELLPDILEAILDEVGVEQSQAFAKAASSACLSVASAMFAADKTDIRRLTEIFAGKQAEWVLGEVKVHPFFFMNWFNWCQSRVTTNGG